MNEKKPRLAVCSSASFYKTVIELSYKLEALNLTVILPKTAQQMKQEGRENDDAVID